MAGAVPTLFGLIAVLSAAPPHTHEQAERALGVQLPFASDTGLFRFYEARNVRLANGVIVSVQFREPEASPGAYVLFDISGSCITRNEVEQHFTGLHNLGDEMRAHNPPPSTFRTLTRREPWGKLDFDFAEQGDCLKSAWVAVK